MKAKKVYEFKRTRKQGLSNKTNIGIDQYSKIKIKEWLNKWVSDLKYEIKDDLSVIIYDNVMLGNTDITEIPINDLTIQGHLDLENTPIKILPSNLKLIWNGYLNLSECKNIDKISNNIEIESTIFLSNSSIREISDFLIIKKRGSIFANNTNLEKLPDNLTIVPGDLNLTNTLIKELPPNLKEIKGNADFRTSKIERLPNSLSYVGGYLDLINTPIKTIPENLKAKFLFVERDVFIPNSVKYEKLL